LAELHELRAVRTGPWMLNGDFNMIYRAEDRNNDRLNGRLMGQFQRFLNDAVLKECHLNGRLFTWSNERSHLTLERIDRVFISNEWEAISPNNFLHSLSSLCSDHAPLLLAMEDRVVAKKRFHFRSFWVRARGFLEAVASAWHCPLRNANPFRRLDWLFHNTTRVLTSWSS
jgi:hypothetical protein